MKKMEDINKYPIHIQIIRKTSYLNVLLAELIVSVLKPDNNKLQRLSEM
jgi:hypothetical protein